MIIVTLTLCRKIPEDPDDVKQMEQKLGNNTKCKHNETQMMILLYRVPIVRAMLVLLLSNKLVHKSKFLY